MQKIPRLINNFVPEKYQLKILLNHSDKTFGGIVKISGVLQPKNNHIVLHSKNLSIKSIILDDKSADFIIGKNDELKIIQPKLKPGKHKLEINYDGDITDSMYGLYPCYFDYNGTKKHLLVTQFESHSAREVFPCIDEPEAKAIFEVTLITKPNLTVLGNMPVKKQEIKNNELITTFDDTPVMSCYLLAWVVGELHKKSAKTKSGVEVNVWATPVQSEDSLNFALDIATRSIDFYDEYFKVPYPLPKCDHVALPDFANGAMENWGLITYREIALLADPKNTSISNQHYVATVIAHELSHQWFGNLVTMKWWNDLWLNESFASFIEYLAVDSLEPKWNMWLDFASNECLHAFNRDSLSGVQSVQIDVNHPDEIETLFDGAIVYAKGAHLIQMLKNYISEKDFRLGLKEYFCKFAYKNTEASDLWDCLSKVSNKNINKIMTDWISQPGFPVLSVTKNNNKITLSQHRLQRPSDEPDNTIWSIPLNSNCDDLPEIFDDKKLEISSNKADNLRFNIGSYCHYITHYDDNLFEQIITEIKNNKLNSIDKIQVLNDQILLAKSGLISNAKLIDLLLAYKNETNESVWDTISVAVGELKKFVNNNAQAEKKLHELVKLITSSQYERLGWDKKDNEPENDTKLRDIIIGLTIYAEDKDAILQAKKIYSNKRLTDISPELRRHILTAVVRYTDDQKITDLLLNTYKTTTSSQLKHDICYGLTATRNNPAINHLLEIIKDKKTVRPQDTAWWIAYLLHNKFSQEKAWNWIRTEWKWITKTFCSDKSYMDYPKFAANTLSNRKQYQEYREFFEPLQDNPILNRVIKIGIKELADRLDIVEKDQDEVCRVLSNF